jgi:hypothetical protein
MITSLARRYIPIAPRSSPYVASAVALVRPRQEQHALQQPFPARDQERRKDVDHRGVEQQLRRRQRQVDQLAADIAHQPTGKACHLGIERTADRIVAPDGRVLIADMFESCDIARKPTAEQGQLGHQRRHDHPYERNCDADADGLNQRNGPPARHTPALQRGRRPRECRRKQHRDEHDDQHVPELGQDSKTHDCEDREDQRKGDGLRAFERCRHGDTRRYGHARWRLSSAGGLR